VAEIRIPAPAPHPQRTEGLWEHTCFEAFVAPEGGDAYWELNLAPSGHWNAYRFDRHREGMRPEARARAPRVAVERASHGTLTLRAEFDLAPLPELTVAPLDVGLAAVLEASDGTPSYWALEHGAGARPDFHRRESFVLRLDGDRALTDSAPMVVVHHLENSRSQRVLWLLEELGVPYEVKRYERDPKTLLAPSTLKAVHPLGKSPVVTDDGLTVAESGAIVEYLVERYGQGRLAPPHGTSPERIRYVYWLHYAEGSLMPLLVMTLVLSRVPQAAPFFIRPIANQIVGGVQGLFLGPNLKLQLDYVERELESNAWFVGDEFTAADVQMSFPLEAAAARASQDAERPKIAAFLERIHARPAYRRALERGGPYQLLR